MMFVLKRFSDGWYVAAPGSGVSYTNKLQNARTWLTRTDAERECCGNEAVRDVQDELEKPHRSN